MRRRFVVAAAVAVATSVAGLALVLTDRDSPRRDSPGGGSSSSPSGPPEVRACAHVERFLDVVRRDGPAPDAIAALADADAAAREAAQADVRWVPLSSGIGALRAAITRDDRDAADVGIRVVRTECARTR